MTSDGSSPAREDPGHPLHDLFPGAQNPADVPVNEALWSGVKDGSHVISSQGERLGRVREKSSHVFSVDVPLGLLKTEELYVPHFAVARIDGDEIHLAATRRQLEDSYDHFYRYHVGQSAR